MPFFFFVKIISFMILSFPDALHPFDIIMISQEYLFVNTPNYIFMFYINMRRAVPI